LLAKEKEYLEDMIIAILLTDSEIRKNPNGRSLHFRLDQRKIRVLVDYLKRFNLVSQFNFDTHTLEGYVKPSLMLETTLKTWAWDNKIQVIDPLSLRLNALYIWLGLFAKKTIHGVAVPTSLDSGLQYTLARIFLEKFKSHLIPGPYIKVKPFSPIMLNAFKSNRPIEESMELSYLLPKNEVTAIKALVAEWEAERSNYVY
jgi:hypothetical protein